MTCNHALLLSLFLTTLTSCGQKMQVAGNDPVCTVEVGPNIGIAASARLPVVEPHIAAHPTDNDHLLAAAMVVTDITRPYESCRLISFVSADGGLRWTETLHDWWGYDPWLAIRNDGATVLSWIGTKGSFQNQYPINFLQSGDGGKTWSDQVQTVDGGYDGTKLIVSNGDFYFTTVHFDDQMGADVVLMRKAGQRPFAEVARIKSKGSRLNFCEPAALANGTVLVPAIREGKEVWVQRYDPKSGTLSAAVTISRRTRFRGYAHLIADANEGSLFRDRVYFVRAHSGGDGGVLVNVSRDGGQTWSDDVRADLFDKAGKSNALVANAAVNTKGVLGISWVDSRRDPFGGKSELWFAASRDGGTTFSAPVVVSDVSSDPRTPANDDVANKFPGGGHYLGIAASPDGSFHVIWSDSRSGVFSLQTSRVKVQ
ncbi:MAG: exo-alpha-sialidase [Cyclobacteriaceae bacterium]|nr:exo-alpha-sialidase [Cyclobacteriaceae bacterium]